MKCKEELVTLPKEVLYERYLGIVYNGKDYDDITNSKMIEEIIKEYQQEEFLFYMCTKKELEFLKNAEKKTLEKSEIKKYEWEIEELNKKCIFSKKTYEVFEDQQENVRKALKMYKEHGEKTEDDLVIFMIAMVKMNAKMLWKVLLPLLTELFKAEEKMLESYLSNPLFHFYCEYTEEWVEEMKTTLGMVSYREYYDILDDYEIERRRYGIAGSLSLNIKNLFDTFYYGFPIQNKKVKKMVEEVEKEKDKEMLFQMIDRARVLNDREEINEEITERNLLEVIHEALDEMPCAAMNGFTPKQYEKEKEQEKKIRKSFTRVPQQDAHLNEKDANLYYKLYFAVLEYVNNKKQIVKDLKRIYKQEGIDAQKLSQVDEYLWQNRELIDEFIEENEYHFSEEELKMIKEFKNAVREEYFIITGFEEEYTEIFSPLEGKIYMTKGIRANLDEVVNPNRLPQIIKTTLLMFKGDIIFNSFLFASEIELGNDMKSQIIKDYQMSMKYYHF